MSISEIANGSAAEQQDPENTPGYSENPNEFNFLEREIYAFPCVECPDGEAAILILGSTSLSERAEIEAEHFDIHLRLDEVLALRAAMRLPAFRPKT